METCGDFNFEAVTKVISAKAAWRHALNTFRSDRQRVSIVISGVCVLRKPRPSRARVALGCAHEAAFLLEVGCMVNITFIFFSGFSSTELVPIFFLYEGISDKMQLLQRCGNTVMEPSFAPETFLTVWSPDTSCIFDLLPGTDRNHPLP